MTTIAVRRFDQSHVEVHSGVLAADWCEGRKVVTLTVGGMDWYITDEFALIDPIDADLGVAVKRLQFVSFEQF